MFCEKCGIEFNEQDKFCYRCGHKNTQQVPGNIEQSASEEAVPVITKGDVQCTCLEEYPDVHTTGENMLEPITSIQSEIPAPPETVDPVNESAAVREQMKKNIGGWGIGLIVMGILSVALPQLLDPFWGVIIIVLGIINLIVRERGMYIVNGIALIFIGIINTIGTLFDSSDSVFFGVYGVFQIYWGIKELIKYGKYGKLLRLSRTKQKMTKWTQLLIAIPIFYIGFGFAAGCYELLMKSPWYAFENFWGEMMIIGQDPVTGQIPAFIKIFETIFYPILAVFRAL